MADSVQFRNYVDPFGQMLKGYDDRIKSGYDRVLKQVQIAKAMQGLKHAQAGEGRAGKMHKLRMQMLQQQLDNSRENARLLPETHDERLRALRLQNEMGRAQADFDKKLLGMRGELLPDQFRAAKDGMQPQPAGPRFGPGRTLNLPGAQPTAPATPALPGISVAPPTRAPGVMKLGGPDPLANPFAEPVDRGGANPLEPKSEPSDGIIDLDDEGDEMLE